MFGATKLGKQQPSPYATSTDFCQIFETDMNRLYRLSFLLTGNEPVAEQCFLGGLQMAQEGNPIFKSRHHSSSIRQPWKMPFQNDGEIATTGSQLE
jgi:hypothetical protein